MNIMAKGKYAARSANARANTAQERITELERQLAEEKAAHVSEVASLKARVEQLQGKLIREVDSIASAAIQATKDDARAQIREVEAAAKARGDAALAIIDEHMELPTDQWLKLYAALGIDPKDDPETGYEDDPRYVRRIGRRAYRTSANVLRSRDDKASLAVATAAKLGAELQ